jgi:hypothetical protein
LTSSTGRISILPYLAPSTHVDQDDPDLHHDASRAWLLIGDTWLVKKREDHDP